MAFDNNLKGTSSSDVLGGEIAFVNGTAVPTFAAEVTTDRLEGGSGDDIYFVDSRSDRVVENYGGGIDTVYSTVTYLLGNSLENLYLFGDDKIGGWGNDGNNILVGNRASNTLVGGAGDDTIDGGAGNDRIHGGIGNDTLTGGTGSDLFVFDTRLDSVTNVDKITDFTVGEDKIGLDVGSPFIKFRTQAELLDSQFTDDSPEARKAVIIYDSETGHLSYDTDGIGTNVAVHFATLDTGLNLSADDFVLIS